MTPEQQERERVVGECIAAVRELAGFARIRKHPGMSPDWHHGYADGCRAADAALNALLTPTAPQGEREGACDLCGHPQHPDQWCDIRDCVCSPRPALKEEAFDLLGRLRAAARNLHDALTDLGFDQSLCHRMQEEGFDLRHVSEWGNTLDRELNAAEEYLRTHHPALRPPTPAPDASGEEKLPEDKAIDLAERLYDAMCWRDMHGESVAAALRKFGIGEHALVEIAYNGGSALRWERMHRPIIDAIRAELATLREQRDRLREQEEDIHTTYESALKQMAAQLTTAGKERGRLVRALHDAIQRPMGVVPDSAAEFYDSALLDTLDAGERK